MTIINAATGEPDSIYYRGFNVATSTNGAHFDNTLVDSAVVTYQYTGEAEFLFGTSLTEFWYHQHWMVSSGGGSDAGMILGVKSSSGFEIRLRGDGGNNSTRMSIAVEITADGTTWTQVGSTFYFGQGIEYLFDMHVKFGSGGFIRIYMDGVKVFSYSATITTLTGTADRVRLGCGRQSGDVRSSEFIVADECTIGMRMNTLRVTSGGTTSAWSNGVTEIDDAAGAIDNNDYIYTNTIGNVSTFVIENVSAPTAITDGRKIAALAATFAAFLPPDATPGDLRAVVRSGSTNYESSDLSVRNDGGFFAATALWATDPDTSVAWTSTGINNAEIGVKAVA